MTENHGPGITAGEVLATFPELTEIKDESLRLKVAAIWQEVFAESPWKSLQEVPKNPATLPASITLVAHTRSVTRQALAIAEVAQEIHGLGYDRDLLIAAANLHDVSKLVEYEPKDDGGAGLGEFGEKVQHGMYGVHKAINHGLPLDVVHAIAVHTKHSHDLPCTWEALIVHYADYADTDGLLMSEGAKISLQK
ncbi:MAG TPA: HD domain-containing protein [Streptosporangiaceae bacterium]